MKDLYFMLWMLSMACSATTLGGLYAQARWTSLGSAAFPREWRLWARIGGPLGFALAVVAGTAHYAWRQAHSAGLSFSSFLESQPELLVAIIIAVVSTLWSLTIHVKETE